MKGDDDLLVVRSSTLYLKSEFFMQGQRLICFSRIIIGGSNFDWSFFIVCMYNSHFVFILSILFGGLNLCFVACTEHDEFVPS